MYRDTIGSKYKRVFSSNKIPALLLAYCCMGKSQWERSKAVLYVPWCKSTVEALGEHWPIWGQPPHIYTPPSLTSPGLGGLRLTGILVGLIFKHNGKLLEKAQHFQVLSLKLNKKIIVYFVRTANITIMGSACFLPKNWANERFAQKKERFTHLLIFGEQPERFAHDYSFPLSNLSESLMVAHFWWAIERFAHIAHLLWAKWAIHSHRSPKRRKWAKMRDSLIFQ